MLVHEIDTDGASGYFLVMCTYEAGYGTVHELMNPRCFWGPHKYPADTVAIVDNYIPDTWITRELEDDTKITSFPEWVDNSDRFLNYIFEDDYFVDEGAAAWSALNREYEALLDYYVAKYAGDKQRLRERNLSDLQDQDRENARTKGWEVPERSIEMLSPITLDEIVKFLPKQK